jgi:hypothetical protein
MNIHQTQAHGDFLTSIGWKILNRRYKKTDTYYFLRKIPLLPFHLLKIQRMPIELIDWKFVDSISKEYRVIEALVEVDVFGQKDQEIRDLAERGFRRANDFMLTTKTRIIDLSQSELQLIKAMKPKTRYNLNKSGKNLLDYRVMDLKEVVKRPDIFERHYELLKINAKRIKMLLLPKSWILKQWKAFENNGFVVEVTKNGEMAALATFYVSDTTCSYNLNGSTELGRKLFAPTLAAWTGLIEGKRRGLQLFDFDGVCDERYAKKQQKFAGFGRFKSGFGGEEVYFPPMYRKKDYKRLFDLR